jgi:hypothetical protein
VGCGGFKCESDLPSTNLRMSLPFTPIDVQYRYELEKNLSKLILAFPRQALLFWVSGASWSSSSSSSSCTLCWLRATAQVTFHTHNQHIWRTFLVAIRKSSLYPMLSRHISWGTCLAIRHSPQIPNIAAARGPLSQNAATSATCSSSDGQRGQCIVQQAARQPEMCVIVNESNQVVGSATRKETGMHCPGVTCALTKCTCLQDRGVQQLQILLGLIESSGQWQGSFSGMSAPHTPTRHPFSAALLIPLHASACSEQQAA